MRVTQNTTSNLVMQNLQIIQQRQETLEQQSSTGLKISAPGDDPTTAQQILKLQSQTAQTNQYSRNITNGTSLLSMSDSVMSSLTNVLTTTKQVALQMSTGTTNADARNAAVQQLQQLRSEVISLGNTQLNGKYIFGGFKNDAPPFDSATGAFTGTNDDTTFEIARGTFMGVTYSGGKLISGAGGGTDIISIFDNMITALGAGNVPGVQAELSNIDSAASQVTNARTVVGTSMNRLTAASSTGDAMNLASDQVLSSLQDADYIKVVSDLSKQQTAYQAAVASSAKIAQISLLDYLK